MSILSLQKVCFIILLNLEQLYFKFSPLASGFFLLDSRSPGTREGEIQEVSVKRYEATNEGG